MCLAIKFAELYAGEERHSSKVLVMTVIGAIRLLYEGGRRGFGDCGFKLKSSAE